jgi:hypothetical protein
MASNQTTRCELVDFTSFRVAAEWIARAARSPIHDETCFPRCACDPWLSTVAV